MLGHKTFEKQSTQFMLLKVHNGIKHGKGWTKFCLPEPVLEEYSFNEQQRARFAYFSSILQHSKNEQNTVICASHLVRLICTCRRDSYKKTITYINKRI